MFGDSVGRPSKSELDGSSDEATTSMWQEKTIWGLVTTVVMMVVVIVVKVRVKGIVTEVLNLMKTLT
jgi:hypothetical protein